MLISHSGFCRLRVVIACVLDRSGGVKNPQVLEAGQCRHHCKDHGGDLQLEIPPCSARGTARRSECYPWIQYRYALNGPPNIQGSPNEHYLLTERSNNTAVRSSWVICHSDDSRKMLSSADPVGIRTRRTFHSSSNLIPPRPNLHERLSISVKTLSPYRSCRSSTTTFISGES